MQITDVLILTQSPRDPTQFSWLLQLALGLPGRARACMSCANHCFMLRFFLGARFGSEVATFQHWGLLKDVCAFHLLCSLRVYPACDGRLLQQTRISRSDGGTSSSFLENQSAVLIWWCDSNWEAPARIHSLQSKGAEWAELAQFKWTQNRLLGAWPFSPSSNLDSSLPACISPWC